MKTICIYHGNCVDGFTSAWVVKKFFDQFHKDEEIEFFKGVYEESPPDVKGKKVIIVDFSYKRPIMSQMAKEADSILVIDHHASAEDELKGIDKEFDNIRVVFDMKKSGAGLVWDYFNSKKARIPLVDFVEDRDLWRFAFNGTKEVYAFISSHEYSFENWDSIAETEAPEMIATGLRIMHAQTKFAKEVIPMVTRTININGYDAPLANVPHFMASEVGHILAQGKKFSVTYFDTPEHRVFSLRSTPEGSDVQAIARSFGGGGHRNAAGFKIKRSGDLAKI